MKLNSKSLFCVVSLLAATLSINAQPGWVISADSIPAKYYGETVANGMLGIVSSGEPMRPSNVILANVYDIYGRGDVSNFLNGFNFLDFNMMVDGVAINSATIHNHKQELRMKQAQFYGSFDVGRKAHVEYTFMALRQLPYTGMMKVKITPYASIKITASAALATPEAFKDIRFEYTHAKHIPLLTATAKTPTRRLELSATSSFLFADKVQPQLRHEVVSVDREQIAFDRELAEGSPFEFYLVGSMMSNVKNSDPRNEAKRLTVYAYLEGAERLEQRHTQQWEELWQSDIRIEGDPESQLWVRSMLYHLYAFVREGSALSVSPMGLSGLGYNGHVFWDADLWIFPALLVLQPTLAESMIEYRFQHLDAARKNAFSHGYKGAMYPWESSDSGIEDTPVFALSGPFEHHISACIALAAWNYYCVTGDEDWLRRKGFPIIKETADFWVSRVEPNATGGYDIKNVVAADEYAENVDNNAFTNAAAKRNLEVASLVASILKEPADPAWSKVASGLVILSFEDGVIREHASFDGDTIKQADVNLLAYPLGVVTDREQILRDLNYYEPLVTYKGPAMTQSIFALLHARLGDISRAYEQFERSYKPHQIMPFGVLAEAAGGDNPYFVTGAGGTLQTVLMGFGGLEITPKGVVQQGGILPPKWKSLEMVGVGRNRETFRVDGHKGK